MDGPHGGAGRAGRRGPRPAGHDNAAGPDALLRFPGDHPVTGMSGGPADDPWFADGRPQRLPRQRDHPIDP